MKCLTNRRWLAVMSLAALVAGLGVWQRTSLAQQPVAPAPVRALPPQPVGEVPAGAVPTAPSAKPVQLTPPAAPAPPASIFYVPSAATTSNYMVFGSPAAQQDGEVRRLMDHYRATKDENERARIAKELPGLIAMQFDARQEARERELKQLEDQLQKLKELHAKRGQQKEQIIDERVRQLLREADGLGWGSDTEVPRGLSSGPGIGSKPLDPFAHEEPRPQTR